MTQYSIIKKFDVDKSVDGEWEVIYEIWDESDLLNPWQTVLYLESFMDTLNKLRIRLIKEHGINHPNPTLKFDVT